MFKNAAGWVDQAKYAKYRASIQPVQVEETSDFVLTNYGYALLMFVVGLIREANYIKEFHLLPTETPIGKEAWWRVEIWEAYWSGHAKGMRVEYDLKDKSRKG